MAPLPPEILRVFEPVPRGLTRIWMLCRTWPGVEQHAVAALLEPLCAGEPFSALVVVSAYDTSAPPTIVHVVNSHTGGVIQQHVLLRPLPQPFTSETRSFHDPETAMAWLESRRADLCAAGWSTRDL